MNSLTISFLISRDVDCSGDVCCNGINEGSGAVRLPLTVSCAKAGLVPACPLGPEVPWKGVDMNFVDDCKTRSRGRRDSGCKVSGVPETRGAFARASVKTSDSALV